MSRVWALPDTRPQKHVPVLEKVFVSPNGRIKALYTDNTLLNLTSNGTSFVHTSPNGTRSGQLSEYCLSRLTPFLSQALTFRNTFATDRPYYCRCLLQQLPTEDLFSLGYPLQELCWPASVELAFEKSLVQLNPDGSIQIHTRCGYGLLLLEPHRLRFSATYPLLLHYNPSSHTYTYKTQKQTFSTSLFPPRWSAALHLALSIADHSAAGFHLGPRSAAPIRATSPPQHPSSSSPSHSPQGSPSVAAQPCNLTYSVMLLPVNHTGPNPHPPAPEALPSYVSGGGIGAASQAPGRAATAAAASSSKSRSWGNSMSCPTSQQQVCSWPGDPGASGALQPHDRSSPTAATDALDKGEQGGAVASALAEGLCSSSSWWGEVSPRLPPDQVVWMMWTPAATYLFDQVTQEVQVWVAADGSIMVSQQRGAYFSHFMPGEEEPRGYVGAAPPEFITHEGSGTRLQVAPLVAAAFKFRNAMVAACQEVAAAAAASSASTKRSCSSNNPAAKASILQSVGASGAVVVAGDQISSRGGWLGRSLEDEEVLQGLAMSHEVVNQQEVEGVGSFQAYADGRIKVWFEDRTVLSLDAKRKWAKLLLPNGKWAEAAVVNPVGVEQYVQAACEFSCWASKSPAQRAQELRLAALVEAELRASARMAAICEWGSQGRVPHQVAAAGLREAETGRRAEGGEGYPSCSMLQPLQLTDGVPADPDGTLQEEQDDCGWQQQKQQQQQCQREVQRGWGQSAYHPDPQQQQQQQMAQEQGGYQRMRDQGVLNWVGGGSSVTSSAAAADAELLAIEQLEADLNRLEAECCTSPSCLESSGVDTPESGRAITTGADDVRAAVGEPPWEGLGSAAAVAAARQAAVDELLARNAQVLQRL